mgnify:FL=1
MNKYLKLHIEGATIKKLNMRLIKDTILWFIITSGFFVSLFCLCLTLWAFVS